MITENIDYWLKAINDLVKSNEPSIKVQVEISFSPYYDGQMPGFVQLIINDRIIMQPVGTNIILQLRNVYDRLDSELKKI